MACITVTAMAQDGIRQNERAQQNRKEIKELFDSMDLTDDQRTQLSEVLTDYSEKMRKIERSPDKRVENHALLRELSTERDEKIREILNKDQYAMYEKKHRELRHGSKQGLHKAGRPN